MTVVGWNDSSAIYIASSESCETNIFVRCWNKVVKKHFQQQQINSISLLQQGRGFCQQNGQDVVKYCIRMKKWWWLPFV